MKKPLIFLFLLTIFLSNSIYGQYGYYPGGSSDMAITLYEDGWYGNGTGSLYTGSGHRLQSLSIPKYYINKMINLSNLKCYNSTSTDYVFDEIKTTTKDFRNLFSSVEVGTGYKITLYSEENGAGDKITAVTNDPDFGNKLFAKKAKSIKIENYVLGDVVMNCYGQGIVRRFNVNDANGQIIRSRNGDIANGIFYLTIPSGYLVRLYEFNSVGELTGKFADFTKDFDTKQAGSHFNWVTKGIAIFRLPTTYNETPLQIPEDISLPVSNDIEVAQRLIFSNPDFYKPWFSLADALGYKNTQGTKSGSTPGDDVSFSTTNFNTDTRTSDYIYKANYRASESNASNASDRLEVTIKDVQPYIKDVIWGEQQDRGMDTSEVNGSRATLCNCPAQNLPPGNNGNVNFGYDKKYTESVTASNTFSWGLNQKVGLKVSNKWTIDAIFFKSDVTLEASFEIGANQQWTDSKITARTDDYTFKLNQNVPPGYKATFYVVQWKATNSKIPYTANIAFDYKVKFDKARLDFINAKVDTPNNLPIFSYTFGDANYGAKDRLRRDYTLDTPQFYTTWNWSNLTKNHYFDPQNRSTPDEYIKATQQSYIVPMEGSISLQGALRMDGRAEISPMTASELAECSNRSSTAKSKSLNNNNLRETLYIDANGNKSFIPVGTTTRTINGVELSSSISSNLNNIEVPLGNTGNQVKIVPTLINSGLKQFRVYNNGKNTAVNSKIKIEVYDLSGNLVVNIFSKIGSENDISNLSTGVYIVKVLDSSDNKELKTEKIIVK